MLAGADGLQAIPWASCSVLCACSGCRLQAGNAHASVCYRGCCVIIGSCMPQRLLLSCVRSDCTNTSPAGRQLHRLQWRLWLRVRCSLELLPVALLPEAAAAVLLAGLAAAAGALLRCC